jgi:hypothetical protein
MKGICKMDGGLDAGLQSRAYSIKRNSLVDSEMCGFVQTDDAGPNVKKT